MAVQAFEFGLHLLAQLQIQCAQRFIQQQHLGAIDQRPGQSHPLTLTTGEFGGLAGAITTESHQLQRLFAARHAIAAANALDLQAIGHVLRHTEVRKEGVILKHGIDVTQVGGQTTGIDAAQTHHAQIRLFETGHQTQTSGLAGA